VPRYIKGPFGSAISINAILKIAFLTIVLFKLLLFKIAQVFGKTCLKVVLSIKCLGKISI
jgi:hypothetical protein